MLRRSRVEEMVSMRVSSGVFGGLMKAGGCVQADITGGGGQTSSVPCTMLE